MVKMPGFHGILLDTARELAFDSHMFTRRMYLVLSFIPLACGGSSTTHNPTTSGAGLSATQNMAVASTSASASASAAHNDANEGGGSSNTNSAATTGDNASTLQEPVTINTANLAPAIPAGPCKAPAPNAWAAMAKGGPVFPNDVDPIGVWLNEKILFVWDAYLPIRQARLYDASCNQWLNVPLPSKLPADFTFDRRYGISASKGKLIVYGPTWELNTGTQGPPGPFRVLLLDVQRRAWIDASPPPQMAGREAKPHAGEGKLVLLEGTKAAVLDVDTATWRAVATLAPFGNVEPGCSRVSARAWDVWTDGAHQRLDLDKLVWTRQTIPTARFQRCFVHSLGPNEDVVASLPIKAPGIPAGMIFDRQSSSHTEITGTGLDGAWLMAAGGEVWTRGGPNSSLYHYDRTSKQWAPIVMPSSSLPGNSPASYSILAVGDVAVLRKVDPPPIPPRPGMAAPTSAKAEASVYSNGSFGKTIALGAYDEACNTILSELGLLCKRAGNSVEGLDPTTLRAVRKFRSPTKPGFLQRHSKSFIVHWGITEAVSGNNCDNPFQPQERLPDQPICTPSHETTFSRAGEGGSVFRIGP